MNSIYIVSVILILLLLVIAVFLYNKYASKTTEYFTEDVYSIDEEIIKIYQEILKRDPSMDELNKIRDDINNKGLNFYTLRQLLMDSDEYYRNIKTQTNTVSPELLKTISDTDQLNRVSEIYEQSLKRKIKSELVLPYHDLFVYVFKNNDQEFRNMLLDERYGNFEYEVLHMIALDREKLFALYDRIYGLKETIVPTWTDALTLKPQADKNKFEDAQGKEVWYQPLPSSPSPKADYMVSPNLSVNSAGYWEQDYQKLSRSMTIPWKSNQQEEVTYASFTPAGNTPIVRKPVEVTAPIYPSSIPNQPVTVFSSPPPIPQLPLQEQPVFSSLATSSIQVMPEIPPPVASPQVAPPPVAPPPSMFPDISPPAVPSLPIQQIAQPSELSSKVLDVPIVMEANTLGELILPPQASSRAERLAEQREEKREEKRDEPRGQQNRETRGRDRDETRDETREEPRGQQNRETRGRDRVETREEPQGQQNRETRGRERDDTREEPRAPPREEPRAPPREEPRAPPQTPTRVEPVKEQTKTTKSESTTNRSGRSNR